MKKLSAIIAAAGLLAGFAAAAPAHATRFWFGGVNPIEMRMSHKDASANDFMELAAPNSPWAQAASRVSVFKVDAQFFLGGRPDEIRTFIDGMRRRHVQIAVEIGVIVKSEACGGGEGYAGADLVDRVGRKARAAGVTIDYMAFDEPVWMTHIKSWGTAAGGAPHCQYPVSKVAQLAAQSVANMRNYFPQIQFGDIEAVRGDRIPPGALVATYVEFARLMQQETGQKLAFFHADIAPQVPGWPQLMAALKVRMHAMGIPVGAIIGGSPASREAVAWVNEGLERLRQTQGNPATALDDVVIQSWQEFPTHYLPESDPSSSTFMLLEAERIVGR